jgi:hypothetical protein
MEVLGKSIVDNRINARNFILEISLKEYYDLSKDVLSNNEYQRRRVKSSSSVYSLLKEDLRRGCLMPPIVMAISEDVKETISDNNIVSIINKNKTKLIILDGLQRSYTIRDLIQEMLSSDDPNKDKVFQNKIRIELYVGINKLGILYRMLTLNTGQTPMSTRHQIEIIYSDYAEVDVAGLRLIREIDDQSPKKLGEYKFRDVIEGFTSFVQRDYLTLERTDILDNIKSLEKLATIDSSNRLFEDFIQTYHKFVKKLNSIYPSEIFYGEDENEIERAFGNNIITIFRKSQSLTGYGAAIGKLMDFQEVKSFEDISSRIDALVFSTPNDTLKDLLRVLDRVRDKAKKIGNDQRLYFFYFYRRLFDKESESYLNIKKAIDAAYNAYVRETQ